MSGPGEEAAEVALLERSGLLDAAWYRARHGDVVRLGMDPARHYLRLGAAMGRDPGPGFSTRGYLEAYGDVAEAGMNPLVHYLRHGRAEGRGPDPDAADPALGARLAIAPLRRALHIEGFEATPLKALAAQAEAGGASGALAARELALWYLGQGTEAVALTKADAALARAEGLAVGLGAGQRADTPLLASLAVLRLLCDQRRALLAPARLPTLPADASRHARADLVLARAGFAPDPAARAAGIGDALALWGLAPTRLDRSDGPAFDRLQARVDPLAGGEGAPLVSVLMAAHEAEATLATALASLSAQSWPALEILVIDDASTDATADIAAAAAAHDPRIRLIRLSANRGAYGARNAGLVQARGRYVCLLDADDWAHPQRIARQVATLEAAPDLLGCRGETLRAGDDLRCRRIGPEGQLVIPDISSLMLRRAPMQARLGGWDGVCISADSELIRRAHALFGPGCIALLEGPLGLQRDRLDSAVRDPATGINGYVFGLRREYLEAQRAFHASADAGALRYDPAQARRPFPVPAALLTGAPPPPPRLVLAAELRSGAGVARCLDEIRRARALGLGARQIALVQASLRPEACGSAATPPGTAGAMAPALRRAVAAMGLRVACYGEDLACDLLLLHDLCALDPEQRFLPRLRPRLVRVVLHGSAKGIPDRMPGPDALAARLGGAAIRWHAAGPQVRAALARAGGMLPGDARLEARDWRGLRRADLP